MKNNFSETMLKSTSAIAQSIADLERSLLAIKKELREVNFKIGEFDNEIKSLRNQPVHEEEVLIVDEGFLVKEEPVIFQKVDFTDDITAAIEKALGL